ncbi:MAG: RNA polymerase factor sigma-54 [Desulfobacca sp.]|uniref:RNA polymerase factor sigma-54 n=1 Tax=Desulfobacca sp. TaxID=2067990 RepID=UPI00404B7667
MALEIKQSLRLTQQLIMTPQLQQAIKLLQLSRLELLTAINQELETNPVLEETLNDDEQESWEAAADETPEELTLADGPPSEVTVEARVGDDFDWDSYLEDKTTPLPRQEREQRESSSLENLSAAKPSLKAHLLWQLQMATLSDTEKFIGALIIGNIDEEGYLQASLTELAAELHRPEAQIEQVLKKIQEFEPLGVGARNLAECLLIQIEHRHLDNPLLRPLVTDYLKYLENRNYGAIARELKVSIDEVARAAHLISQLDPKPGRSFDNLEPCYISPDIFVYKMGDDYEVSLNEDGLPKLRINAYYRDALSGQNQISEETKHYIQGRLKSAVWFIKSIHQRQKTIYRVAKSIVNFQRDFLDHGIAHLKPLTLRQVAEDVQMHESTVSRVTTNKYMDTPQGVFELKFFFNSGINAVQGEQVASESVKDKIRQLVLSEDALNPLSDQEIVNLLKKANINIARRTVAKYREMLGLLSSSKRRRLAGTKKSW